MNPALSLAATHGGKILILCKFAHCGFESGIVSPTSSAAASICEIFRTMRQDEETLA